MEERKRLAGEWHAWAVEESVMHRKLSKSWLKKGRKWAER